MSRVRSSQKQRKFVAPPRDRRTGRRPQRQQVGGPPPPERSGNHDHLDRDRRFITDAHGRLARRRLGADWAAVQAGAAGGWLPHVAALLAQGCAVRLVAQPPFVPAAPWTTAATGWHADQHGVLSAVEPRPDGGGVQPAGRRSWQAPAFWEVLEAAGLRTACVGWPATAPGAGWPGRHVDERFAQTSGGDFSTWAIPAGAVAPPAMREDLRPLRIDPADGLQSQIEALLPGAGAIDFRMDQRPLLLGAALAQTGTIHAVVTAWAEGEWDALCVRHDLLQLIGVGRAADEGIAARAAGLPDMMLGRLLHLADAGTTGLLVSAGTGRGQGGFLMAAGPGIGCNAGSVARLIDVAPTVLARFGLRTPTAGTAIPALAGGSSSITALTVLRPAPAVETRLEDGYPDTRDAAQAAALAALAAEHLLNRAEALMARGELQDAASVLDQLRRVQPAHGAGLRMAAQCAALLGDAQGCRDAALALSRADPCSAWGHLAMAASGMLTQDHEGVGGHLDQAAVVAAGNPEALVRLGGMQMLRERPSEACKAFHAALTESPGMAEALHGLGVALAALGDLPAAERALRDSLGSQPLQPLATLQLASVLSARGAGRRVWERCATRSSTIPASPARPRCWRKRTRPWPGRSRRYLKTAKRDTSALERARIWRNKPGAQTGCIGKLPVGFASSGIISRAVPMTSPVARFPAARDRGRADQLGPADRRTALRPRLPRRRRSAQDCNLCGASG